MRWEAPDSFRASRTLARTRRLACVLALFSSPFTAWPALAESASVAATLNRLSINLPADVAANEILRKPLDELSREPCDRQAIVALANALQKVGYRREAANAHAHFSESCGGYAQSLQAAVNILLGLSDFKGAAELATNLIKMEPFSHNGYFLRALARDGAGEYKGALDDYISTLELVPNKEQVVSTPYFKMAKVYDALGQPCDAAQAVQSWVEMNAPRRETPQTQMMIATYTAKGQCKANMKTGVEVFPNSAGKGVVKLTVLVNGVPGQFILDTGASFVSLKDSFARKANIDIDEGSAVRLHTANGMTDGKRGQAKTIKLRSLEAKNTIVVVQSDNAGAYGANVDGLLGLSFLSRFHVAIDPRTITISTR
ncbi:retropepsin-like aspartic protease [Beijerinckia indica]|uniref:Uncharacterized protein n=1 Tax=Beijerinckia indica subsp. indica (strain ATCC 9039 / DSM 1715 / NCIMB 8712) TaxID=395963 RepID=B2ICJ4_BEII9|nr:retropepsin-like aspartic protease [Beijerinckia indica]ACB93883.1 hypothetical protein Bind_0227 [Beijerinckia indica subsp. indica ATCC 9039]